MLQYVLAVGSSVLGPMFYGDLAEGQSDIHIPDVEPVAFLILLCLEAKNACILLSQSRLLEELTQLCWEVINAQAELAL